MRTAPLYIILLLIFAGASGAADGLASSNTPAALPEIRFILELTSADPFNQKVGHRVFPQHSGPEPEQGEPFYQLDEHGVPLTGLRVTRLTDVSELRDVAEKHRGRYATDPGWGITNGYSKYSNVNVSGEFGIGYATQGWIGMLYRFSDLRPVLRLDTGNGPGLGEMQDVRWDMSGRPGTEYHVYYTFHDRPGLWRQDVLRGEDSERKIYDFGMPIQHEGHMDQSRDARYRAVRFKKDDRVMVFDLWEEQPLSGIIEDDAPADISPEGAWLYWDKDFDGEPARFYSIEALARGDTTRFVELPTDKHGHDGWGYDHDGNEVFAYQDNRTDWFCAFAPATGRLYRMMNMKESGYPTHQHMGRIQIPEKRGWILMTTYSTSGSWADNQIMMLEIRDAAEGGRVWRLGSTFNLWKFKVPESDDSKAQRYWAEAFASIDAAGNHIYWGANWHGEENLELYRLELPPDWHLRLNALSDQLAAH